MPFLWQILHKIEDIKFYWRLCKYLAIIANLLSMRIQFGNMSKFCCWCFCVIFGLDKGCKDVKKVKTINSTWFATCYLWKRVNTRPPCQSDPMVTATSRLFCKTNRNKEQVKSQIVFLIITYKLVQWCHFWLYQEPLLDQFSSRLSRIS